jgi:hypothetical protein
MALIQLSDGGGTLKCYGYTVADSRQEVTLRITDNKWCCRSLTRSDV